MLSKQEKEKQKEKYENIKVNVSLAFGAQGTLKAAQKNTLLYS